jgi:transcriptional regulator with XRE-family HTH domain
MQVTQIEAADKLGWTQGAFSQYLNGITELGPSAVVKLANFLEIDPTEIDPQIFEKLPNVRKTSVRFTFDNATDPLTDSSIYVPSNAGIFRIQIRPEYVGKRLKKEYPHFATCECQLVCFDPKKSGLFPRATNNELTWVIQRKKEKTFDVVYDTDLPASKDLAKKFVLLGVAYY